MQWFQDEKIKHRIIGLAVLISIALVFVPAMVKKSNQRLDRNMNLSLNLPPKPAFPHVEAVKPQVLFKTVKVAQVVLPEVVNLKKTVMAARAESLSGQTMATRSVIQKTPTIRSAVVIAKVEKPAQRVAVNTPTPQTNKINHHAKVMDQTVTSAKPLTVSKGSTHRSVPQRNQALIQSSPRLPKISSKSDIFSVQVASFARPDNALILIRTLQKKGFKATYDKQGSQYRVLVGELGARNEAKYLQQQLASTTQMTGFIVKIG